MDAKPHFLEHQGMVVSYVKAGNGPVPLLAFHGFGQDHSAFANLFNPLGGRFTIYSFDLFFHGQSHWPEREVPLSKKFWKSLLLAFIKKNHLFRFSLMGYSLGAKFALATLEAIPERILSVYFLAPDGIQTNFWYKLATYPAGSRKIFKGLIDSPGLFQFLASSAIRLNLLDKSMVRFAQSQMDTAEKRKRVYYAWTVFRHLKFDMEHIAYLINMLKIQTTVIVGQHDKIITLENTQKLLKELNNYQLEILQTGHNGLIDESLSVWDKIK